MSLVWRSSTGKSESKGASGRILIARPNEELVRRHGMSNQVCDSAHVHPVARSQALQLRDDPPGAPDSARAAEILNQIVAIESGAAISDLHEPDCRLATSGCMPPALITFLFATRTAGGTGVKQNFAARKRAGQLDQKRSQLNFFQVVEDSRCNQEDRIGSNHLP